ncbi:MAG: hypothetical protein AABZ74_11680 [Cyanobacteriota bacterium]
MSGISIKATDYTPLASAVKRGDSDTPLVKVLNSTPAKFASDHNIVAGAGLAGSAVLIYKIADKSELASTVAKKGLVPAVGMGVAAFGGLVVHDAVANRKNTEIHKTVLEGTAGTAIAMAGVEIAGRALGTKYLQPVTALAKTAVNNPTVFLTTGVTLAGGTIVASSIQNMKKDGINLKNAGVLAAATPITTGAAALTAVKTLKSTSVTADVLIRTASIATGAAVGVGSYAMLKQSEEFFKKDDNKNGLLFVAGAVGTAMGGTALVAGGVSYKAIPFMAKKMIQNPLLTTAAVTTAFSATAFYSYAQAKK